ncbi:hypothetical protein [Paenibacillus macerans]|uniref:hypothetical protein n=1 Tax=Paenibacillus macerans TaxID=44252 RepID=UPI003D3240B8
MDDLPKREPYERQFLTLIAKGMRILIEERQQEEEKQMELEAKEKKQKNPLDFD